MRNRCWSKTRINKQSKPMIFVRREFGKEAKKSVNKWRKK